MLVWGRKCTGSPKTGKCTGSSGVGRCSGFSGTVGYNDSSMGEAGGGEISSSGAGVGTGGSEAE
jgi:hypothetical protein